MDKEREKVYGDGYQDGYRDGYDKGYDDAQTISNRPHGKWIDFQEDGYVECPFCDSMTECDGNKDELHYCFSCGAELS